MAKHTIDFDDYEERSGYNGDQPKPGLYAAKLVKVEDHTAQSSGAEGFHWVFELTSEPYAGFQGHIYSNVSTTKWKTQEIIKAITGGKTEAFVLDTDKADRIVSKARPVKVRIKQEKYNDEMRARMTSVIVNEGAKAPAAKPKADPDPWEDEDEDDDEG